MSNQTQIFKLLDKLKKEHDAAVRSLDRAWRYTAGTASSRKAQDSYEKHAEAFDATMAQIQTVMTGGHI